MKIFIFTGGLGNQLFEYAFIKYLRNLFPNEKFYGNYGNKTKEHYGLELDKWFNVDLPPEHWWVFPFIGLFYIYKQLFPKSKLLDLYQTEWKNQEAIVLYPFKFNKTYIPQNKSWVTWKIDENKLNDENKKALAFIKKSNSCFIHVRRGDYLSPQYKKLFEGCCTKEYYEKAIAHVKSNNTDVKFICFSDDIEWVKENLNLDNETIFVNWNIGVNSPLDMFLMSQCKNGIIANSTFSYWGAQLGNNKEKIIYPLKWWNSEKGNPNIFPHDWIGL